MLEAFEKAAQFCAPPCRLRSACGRRPAQRVPRHARPHSALPLPRPPPTRLAAARPLSARASPEKGFGKNELYHAFDTIDTERKGVIGEHELQLLLELLGISYTQVQFMLLLSKLDVDGSGTVDREVLANYFVVACIVKPRPTSGKVCKALPLTLMAETLPKEAAPDAATNDTTVCEEHSERTLSSPVRSPVEQAECLERDSLREKRARTNIKRLLKSQACNATECHEVTAVPEISTQRERRLSTAWWSSTRSKSLCSSKAVDFQVALENAEESREASASSADGESPTSPRRSQGEPVSPRISQASSTRKCSVANRGTVEWTAGARRPIIKRQSTADVSMIEDCKGRRQTNKQMERRIRAFDARQRHKIQGLGGTHGRRSVAGAHGRYKSNNAVGVSEGRSTERAAEAEEVELGFHIVDWSSQKPNHEATALQQPHGRWESFSKTGSAVHSEYLVFGVHGQPTTITGIELTMNGTSTNPRRCKLQFSDKQHGPWHDAWTFATGAQTALTCRAKHEYGKLRKAFKDALLNFCRCSLGKAVAEAVAEDLAWEYMDSNGTGRLSRDDFEAVFLRLQKASDDTTLTNIDAIKVFRDIDVQGTGNILLEHLFSDELVMPAAGFWRLLILDNWGSPSSILLSSPLRLFSMEATAAAKSNTTNETQCRFLEKMVMALTPECLHMTEEVRVQRRMAREYKVSEKEADLICTEFQKFGKLDTDGKRQLQRPEFEEVVAKVLGFQDKKELPAKRLEFFWRQADTNCDGLLNLEEFFAWYSVNARRRGSGSPVDQPATKRASTAPADL